MSAAILAEAGSREAPSLQPGFLTEVGEAEQTPDMLSREAIELMQNAKEGSCRPTKLFIGGISRHTTTKQLRDHFAQFGRVLDCVAMRQPDGRPRGFGYVTLDSPTAAARCLAEPQTIDNRVVDMKSAVPEGSDYGGSPTGQAGFNMNMFGGQADYNMGMFAGQGMGGWPEAAGPYGGAMPWWTNGKQSPSNQGMDCVDLLSAARDMAMSHPGTPQGLALQAMGLREYGEIDPLDPMGLLLEPQSTLIPAEFQQPPGASQKMSASAPEFVPYGAQAPAATKKAAPSLAAPATTPLKDQPQKSKARAPLGELTNIVEAQVGDLLKPFKPPSNKLADVGHGQMGNDSLDRRMRPTGLLLDDEVMNNSSPSSGSGDYDHILSPESTPERVQAKAGTKAEEDSPESDIAKKIEIGQERYDNLEDNQGPASLNTSNMSDSGSDDDSFEQVVVNMDDLPSVGSAQHGTGECKRCNFFPKGRCSNGKNCSFCHYSHDKRKPSRQEKRERRAAWLEQQGGEGTESPQGFQAMPQAAGLLLSEMRPEVVQYPSGPLLGKPVAQQGCFPVFHDEGDYNDEALAFSMFPGLNCSAKLPAPLPLPGLDMAGPALPPGLATPWQQEVASTRSTPLSAAFLGTVPTPQQTPASSVASTPMPTPLATPTGAMSAEARPFAPAGPSTATFGTQTFGTQTDDYKCNKCIKKTTPETIESEAPHSGPAKQGCLWARDELLRLRDAVLKMPGASETGGGILFTKSAAAITSSGGK